MMLALPNPRSVLIPPVPFLSGSSIRLFLTSATILFAELLLIRWIPANVVYVGFFSNFLLIGSFLGIGLGILVGRSGRRPVISPFPLLLFGVVLLVANAQLNVQLRSTDELFFGLTESKAADTNFIVLPLVVVLATVLMASLAMPLGPLLRAMRPLRAYAIDIGGSLAGIALFTLLSAAGTPPSVWFGVLAVLLVALALGTGIAPWSAVNGAAMAAVLYLSLLSPALGGSDRWSPYYRVTTYPVGGVEAINVNGIPHQTLWPAADPRKEPFYDQVYRWFPDRTFDRVLVVGAGSGSDTAIALSKGARHVDAVEIDPLIAAIGQADHPDHPYRDPRVDRYIDDGRNFLRNASGQYDLIVFALPDSLTLVSSTANLRLESFLFTQQAFEGVRHHLAPAGVFVLYNYYRQPWLVEKLAGMLQETFGPPPLVRTYDRVMAALATGPAVLNLQGAPPPGDRVDPLVGGIGPRPATDDWPFLYLKEPTVAPYYLVALGLILLFAVLAVGGAARASGTPLRRFSPHFFVLGIAFLLLETRSLVAFSLLFGTTWLVNALAFFAILVSVLAAVGINARFRFRRSGPLYAALLAALALGYLLPPESLLVDPPWLRYVLASATAFAPVFFANLVFAYSFRDTRTADMAFASNLLGAMLGGALEYVSLITGYRALLIVVAGLYGGAYLLATRVRLLADRDLEIEAARVESAGDPVLGFDG